jgi:hypothetical protein
MMAADHLPTRGRLVRIKAGWKQGFFARVNGPAKGNRPDMIEVKLLDGTVQTIWKHWLEEVES